MALRFLLGAAEAGFGPSVPYLLSFFYLRNELGFRSGIFLAAAPLANTFAGALAYAVTSGHSKLANWRLLFLVEGLPTILAAPLAWYFLPDSPTKARFLTEEEKEVARARVIRQHGHVEENSKVNFREILQTLCDLKAWLTAVSNLPLLECINTDGLTAHVFLMQRLVFIVASLSADDSQRDGVFVSQGSGTICSTLSRLHCCDGVKLLVCRPHTTTWFSDHFSKLSRWPRIYTARDMHSGGPKIFWHVFGGLCLPCDCQHLTLGCQQSRIRLSTRNGVSQIEALISS